jgi:YidC/Oxa1 family membrane protein insertase
MLVFVSYVMFQEERRSELVLEAEQIEQAAQDLEIPDADPIERRIEEDRPRTETTTRADTRAEPGVPTTRVARSIPRSIVTLENENVIARISNGPGLIESWQLREFEEYVPEGEVPIELIAAGLPALRTEIRGVSDGQFANSNFEIISQASREVTQRAEIEAGVLTRTIRIDERGYGFDLELTFESAATEPVDASFEFVWPTGVSDREDFKELSLVSFGDEEGVTRTLIPAVGQPGFFGMGGGQDGREIVEGRSRWAGFDIQYFAGVVIDPNEESRFKVRFEALESGETAETRMTLPSVSIDQGRSIRETLRGFLGPKTPDALEAAGSGMNHSVNRGFSWLEPLTRFFEISLDQLYRFIPNYGLAIIVLTILVRVFTAPLMAKQMRSAERMRALQPRMKELQDRWKDDRQKLSEETMKLYKEEKVNPVAGCLPLLLQFPVLIGLFYALRSSIGLRHAPFTLWITDLSQPATLFVMPGLDFPIRLLPIIMGASMFVQQKMTPTTGMDPTQARMMLIMMPAMMLFISYTFPSGLVLYWTVSNLLGIAQQYWIRSKTQPAS